MADENAGNLADLISLLWRHGQRKATRRSTAQVAPLETPHPLESDLQQLWHEQIARTDRRLSEGSPTDEGAKGR